MSSLKIIHSIFALRMQIKTENVILRQWSIKIHCAGTDSPKL